jgi:eukaryotic-like serine/threonine-protein kinase
MTPERWQRVKEIFQAAIQCAPGERSAFLSSECGDDESLRQEVDSLIASHEKDGSFIDSPAYEAATELLRTEQELKPGQTVGHYEILSTLGRGGMGEVYLARDTKLGRKVALKFLPADFTKNADRLHRFEQEARAVSALNHPNILTIHEVGEVDGRHFIATEYVDGQTLRERLARGGLKVVEALESAIQIASALAAAHQEGIIHRDIKPDNIMLRRDGLVKVLDFGLVKLTESKQSGPEDATRAMVKTSTGIVMGTTAYMSPEQARGLPLDARTDIWSFGVVLYETVTGRAPFVGPTSGDLIAQILEREPPALSSYKQDVPAELQQILNKALRKDRAERYQTISELLADLKSLKLSLDFGIHSRPPKQSSPVSPSRSKTVAIASLLLILLVAGAIVSYKLFISTRRQKTTGPDLPPVVLSSTQISNWSGLDTFPTLSPDGNAVAFSSDRSGAFEIYVIQLTAGSRLNQITSDAGQNLSPAWSPDGKSIAYHSRSRGGIWTVPAMGGLVRQLTQFGSRPSWSPDGSTIAFQSVGMANVEANSRAMPPSTLWLVSSQGGEAKPLTKAGNPIGGHGAPAWSPNGKRIAFTAGDYYAAEVTIWTMSLDGSDFKKLIVGALDPLYAADGERIYFAKDFGVWSIRIVPESGEPLGEPGQLIPATSHGRIRYLSVSANGKKLAFSPLASSSNLWTIPLSLKSNQPTGPPLPLTQNTNFRTNLPVFSPDGLKIAYTSWLGIETNICLIDADGRNQTQVTTGQGNVPSWLDNQRIAFLTRRERRPNPSMWTVALGGGNEKPLLDFDDKVEFARVSPDGKTVAFNSKKAGTTNIWTIGIEGTDAKQLTFDGELMAFPCWSPDSKFLAFQMKRGENDSVAIIPSSGGTPTQLTFDNGLSWSYSWSPDGDKIAFAGFRNGQWNVWWVSRSTKEQKQLTNYSKMNSFVRYPAWSPLGKQMVFEYAETTGNIWLMELK